MTTKETTVERTVVIDAPAEVIWKALSVPGLDHLQLLTSHDGIDLREGRDLEWYDREDTSAVPRIKGRITVVAPPRRIAFMAFMPSTKLPDVPENYTAVNITLRSEEDGLTTVTVNHGDFAEHKHGTRLAREAGDHWVEMLIRLKDVVEREAAA
jgi:uncharacterized protein YndB with AHSA1/START domain